MKDVSDECEPEWLDAEDPLFILYTSGSTGKPKVQHHGFKLLFFYSADLDMRLTWLKAPVMCATRLCVQGVLHTVAGYMLYTSLSFKHVFDHHHDDVYWCTADIGWITGHSYITYGPLANGATSVLVSWNDFFFSCLHLINKSTL